MLDLRLAVSDDAVADRPIKITCPPRIHKERTGGKLDKESSLAVYADHIHCYGCGYNRSGVWGLADLLGSGIDEARAQASKYDSETLDAYRERAATEARRDPLPGSLRVIYHDLLRSRRKPRLNWLYARGLDDRAIDEFQLGHDGKRFVIPVSDADEKLITLRFRRDDGIDDFGPKYSGMKGRNGLYLYPEWKVARDDRDYLVVVEGELDAVRLWQDGIPAISATNGAGQVHKLPALIRERFPRITHLIVATDMDEPGQAAAGQTIAAAAGLGFSTAHLTWEDGKDVSEAYQLGSLYRKRILDCAA